MTFVFKAAVVGAGTMGGQIAQTIAAAGIPVVLKDVSEELVQAGLAEARKVTEGQLAGRVEQGRLTEEQAAELAGETIGLITGTTSYEGFGDVDFVIEAVPERLEIKHSVFAELDAATPGHAILASNTSSLSISEIGSATLRPDKVVGFHFFYPASVMPLIEVVEGEDTSPETVLAAITFVQAIRKQPIACLEAPGFVVNRILMSGLSEIWREQEAKGLSIGAIDEAITEGSLAPIGPYALGDMLGLDTVLHVAEDLADAFGDRFVVPEPMRALVAEGRLGAKTGDGGFYDATGEPRVAGDAAPDAAQLSELLTLKLFVEAALVLEEGVATHRDIDFGLIAGAGLDPGKGFMPPFMRADADGLDVLQERLEAAAQLYGERFAPPVILRRLVAQGRLGLKSGQGFYAYAKPDDDQPGEKVLLETRGDVAIAWLANGALNSISPQVVEDLEAIWRSVVAGGQVRALVVASTNPFLFCAGADVKAMAGFDNEAITAFIARMHGLMRELESSSIVTIAAVNGMALGGGCELAMNCDVRIAARSALFGQPEIKLGIIPGFGGTQRLRQLVGAGKALEMNLVGDPIGAIDAYELGLVNRVVEDHELLDTALAWARRLAGQAPLAVEAIKTLSTGTDLDAGLTAEETGFPRIAASADGHEGIAAFLGRRPARWTGG